ncbi:DUF6081 family protein [Krasilnikovia sp. M28-CT-15]|uniref:DUF6081 family protein n=1 Tax=Krasilnikovia sp. M28-CT-15 TaxID=3373540 RepID=UPI00399D1BA3
MLATLGVPAPAAAGSTPAPYQVTWDDFRSGFSHTGDDARWTLFPAGPLPEGDGVPTTSAAGLTVVPTGRHPVTGRPAFAFSTGQEADNGGGEADHVKWYAAANHTSSAGYTGFDTVPGQVFGCDATISARTFGTAGHPFGGAVRDPQSDPRLAAGALSVVDMESWVVFDFFITNHQVYAYYERLPQAGAGKAAFSYAVPVATRTPDQWHHLAISYDRSAGVAAWQVNGREVLRVNQVGHRPVDRRHLLIDTGGADELVTPRQLSCGLATFTLLDGEAEGTGGGLVRLSSKPDHYFDPSVGFPSPQHFVDDASRPGNRLWGQGAQLSVRRVGVTSLPSR